MPILSIDTSQTPNVISITGLSSVPDNYYLYTIEANHDNQNTFPISYYLEINVMPDPCRDASVSVPA